MDAPVIQLRLKGRLVQALSLEGGALRIGRMKENDIVINNASVSRFHAVIRYAGGRVILEDSGSENGCYVNGSRIEGSTELEFGDEVLIGKHRLVLTEGGGENGAPQEGAEAAKSDAYDASNTYFVGVETQATMLEGSRSEAEQALEPDLDDDSLLPTAVEEAAETAPPEETEPPAEDAVVDCSADPIDDPIEDPIDDPIEDPIEEAEPVEAVEPLEASDESPFEFGMEADLGGATPEEPAVVDPGDYDVELTEEEVEECDEEAVAISEPAASESAEPEEPSWYAGIIIQNEGKLERIISWDQDRLVAGRSRECEILLDQAEISRRHAMFVRDGERYEVRDLDSINGVLVNGERVKRRELEVGDVIHIEGFELTFLLDRQPIASEVKTDALAAPVAEAGDNAFNMTMIDAVLPIGSALAEPSADAAGDDETAEIGDVDDLEPDEPEEEEPVEVEALSPPEPCEIEDAAPYPAPGEVLTLELRVRLEDLPLALRDALADVEVGELKLPVEVVLKASS